jgi:serine/threonine protein kinase/tetratricopeptide (TPR) repeat protein
MSVEIGTQLGRYKILSRLGAGGMAEVYLAQDTQLKRSVALKLLSDRFAFDESHLHRFAQEARAASSLNHPNILTIYEIGEAEHAHFIATELIEGQTLRRRLIKVRLNLSEALDISIQVAAALTATHAVGIVHRDIKPENIMLRTDGFVKVLDFGLAKLTQMPEDTSSSASQAPTIQRFDTEPGSVLGTTRYMSPEQVRGLPLDSRTDIWSLGVTLYEMITGRQPFDAPSSGDVIVAILEREPVPLERHVRGAPAELQLILSKALTKDISQRYQRAQDLMNDLRRVKRRQEIEIELGQPTLPQVSAGSAGSHSDGTVISGHQISFGSLGPASSSSASRKRRVRKKIDSIAILPLTNESGDPETEYLADGITETIINTLSKLPKLRVMARSTVFRYKGKEVDPQQVGFDLGIRSVFMGRLLQRGDKLVINTELIDVTDGSQLWGEQYNRKHSEILAVQDEIATEISDKLRLKLTQVEKKQLTRRATENIEAYHLYLKGRYHWNKRTGPALLKGRDYFRQAIDVDPNYALAYAGLADSYTVLATWNIVPSNEAFPKSKAAATRALELDRTLSEAHASLGFVSAVYDWEWARAEKQFKLAIKANPTYATAYEWYALFLSWTGRHDEAVTAVRHAQNLDPLTPIITSVVGVVLHYARRYQEAIDEYDKVLELDPAFVPALCFRGAAYARLGRYEEAIADERGALAISGPTPLPLDILGHILAIHGNRREAEETLEKLRNLSKEKYISAFFSAHTYVGLGQYDQALDCLEQACEERFHRAVTVKVDPSLDPLHPDPRFQKLLKRMGLSTGMKRVRKTSAGN